MKVELLEVVDPIISRVLELSKEPAATVVREAVRQEIGRLLNDVKPFDQLAGLTRSADGGAPSAEYALICWVDEILTACLPGWTETILELDRCKTRLSAVLFWDQADRAVVRAGSTRDQAARDVLEVFALCVELRFVGNRADILAREQWLQDAWKRLEVAESFDSLKPSEARPTHEPLTGWFWLRRSILVGWVAVAAFLVALAVKLLRLAFS